MHTTTRHTAIERLATLRAELDDLEHSLGDHPAQLRCRLRDQLDDLETAVLGRIERLNEEGADILRRLDRVDAIADTGEAAS